MAFSITKTWTTGDVLTASDLNTSFSEVENVLNGGLTSANLSSTAGIVNGQLANPHYELIVPLHVPEIRDYNASASATFPVAVCGIPGTTTDGASYNVISANAVLVDSGNAGVTLTFQVDFGDFSGAANTWTTATNYVASHSLTSVTANATIAEICTVANSGTALTLSNSVPKFFAVFVTACSANTAASAVPCGFFVTLKLRRTDGLRSA